MTWITEHKFLCGLSATTLVLAAGLVWYGNQGGMRYDAAKSAFDQAYQDASSYEKFKPYPNQENLDAKTKSLEAFRADTEALQDALTPYRPEEMVNISTQAFTDLLKAANEETRQAFSAAGTQMPDEYFCGFSPYKTRVVAGNATPILAYQLGTVKRIMLDLAKAKPTRIINVHRPQLDEEIGKTYEPQADQVARGLPLEVVFQCREESLRQFLSSLVNSKEHFTVVRSLRIKNQKQEPPNSKDAEFDGKRGGGGPVVAPVAPVADFNALFSGVETASPAPTDGAAAPAAPAPAPAPAPATEIDSSRILSQVLGNEEVVVFIRLDTLLYLPSKKLP